LRQGLHVDPVNFPALRRGRQMRAITVKQDAEAGRVPQRGLVAPGEVGRPAVALHDVAQHAIAVESGDQVAGRPGERLSRPERASPGLQEFAGLRVVAIELLTPERPAAVRDVVPDLEIDGIERDAGPAPDRGGASELPLAEIDGRAVL